MQLKLKLCEFASHVREFCAKRSNTLLWPETTNELTVSVSCVNKVFTLIAVLVEFAFEGLLSSTFDNSCCAFKFKNFYLFMTQALSLS